MCLVTIVALALRLQELGSQNLGPDEARGVVFASRPLPELMRLLATEDLRPPLPPVLLHFWMAVAGKGEFVVRLPSALAGALVVPVVYIIGRRLELLGGFEGHRGLSSVGSVAAVLVTFSSFHLAYSQEARGYMAATLLGLLSSYLLLEALAGRRRRVWVAYVAATVVALYTDYSALLVLAFQLLFALLVLRSHVGAWRRWLPSLVAIGLAFLPWAGYALAGVEWIAGAAPGAVRVDATLGAFLLQAMGGGGGMRGAVAVPSGLGITLIIVGLVALARGGVRGRRLERFLFLLLYVAVPAVLLLAAAHLRPEFDAGYLLVATPAFYLVSAWGLVALLRAASSRRPLLRRALLPGVGVAVLAGTLAIPAVYGEGGPIKLVGGVQGSLQRYGDYRGAVAYLAGHARPGDVVVLMRDSQYAYEYYGRQQIPWHALEPLDDFDGAIQQLNQLAEEYRRVWFLLWQREWADPAGYVLHVMEDQATEVAVEASFPGLGLRLFELTPGREFRYYPRLDNKAEALFGERLEFWGWKGSAERAAGGESVTFDLHWRPLKSVGSDLKVDLTLVDGEGHVWARTDEILGTPLYPSSRWREQEIIHEQHWLNVLPGTPPGEYRVALRLHEPTSMKGWRITRWSGEDLGADLFLGSLTVLPTPPERFPLVAEVLRQPPTPSPSLRTLAGLKALVASLLPVGEGAEPFAARGPAANWELGRDRFELLESQVGARYSQPGDGFELAVAWRVPATPGADYVVRLALLDKKGDPKAEQLLPLVAGHPSSRWRAGETVVGRYWLRLPATLPYGKYEVAATPAGTGEREVSPLRYARLSTLEVPEPKPATTAPLTQDSSGVAP